MASMQGDCEGEKKNKQGEDPQENQQKETSG